MNSIRVNSIFKYSVRFLLTAFVCTLFFISSAFPAAAVSRVPSDPTKGETKLGEIQRLTDESVYAPPMTLEEIQERSDPEKGGINEVQEAADIGKMKTPANSQQETTVVDVVKGMLNKVEKDEK